ncbi:MAG TPA: hypothetical protein ENK60_06610 [Anaerolineae bacterium]|nr:hypothetical protein [Anaerolineae bacterium]
MERQRLIETARAFQHWRTSLARAQELSMPYDEARAQYELGRHLPEGAEERAHRMAAAIQGFATMGAHHDLRVAQALADWPEKLKATHESHHGFVLK